MTTSGTHITCRRYPPIDRQRRPSQSLRMLSLTNSSRGANHPVILRANHSYSIMQLCWFEELISRYYMAKNTTRLRCWERSTKLSEPHISQWGGLHNHCYVCKYFRAPAGTAPYAHFQCHRITPTYPFNVAVDFTVPFFARTQAGDTKCFFALFTFVVARVIHLERNSSVWSLDTLLTTVCQPQSTCYNKNNAPLLIYILKRKQGLRSSKKLSGTDRESCSSYLGCCENNIARQSS